MYRTTELSCRENIYYGIVSKYLKRKWSYNIAQVIRRVSLEEGKSRLMIGIVGEELAIVGGKEKLEEAIAYIEIGYGKIKRNIGKEVEGYDKVKWYIEGVIKEVSEG